MDQSTASWRRSSRCESVGCVEVARLDGAVGLRNSHLPQTQLAFDDTAWRDFIAGMRAGDFDRS